MGHMALGSLFFFLTSDKNKKKIQDSLDFDDSLAFDKNQNKKPTSLGADDIFREKANSSDFDKRKKKHEKYYIYLDISDSCPHPQLIKIANTIIITRQFLSNTSLCIKIGLFFSENWPQKPFLFPCFSSRGFPGTGTPFFRTLSHMAHIFSYQQLHKN